MLRDASPSPPDDSDLAALSVSMPANYLWLVWFRPQAPGLPKRWALFLTYEPDEDAFGTFYEAHADVLNIGHYAYRLTRGLRLAGEDVPPDAQYQSRLLLGTVRDEVVESLGDYCDTATAMVNDHNRDQASSGSSATPLGCRDWCLMIIASLEDGKLLAKGTLESAKECN